MTNLSGDKLNNVAAPGPQGEGRDCSSTFPAYPEYKDSEVEWVGGLPVEWQMLKLKRVARLQSGEFITSDAIEEDAQYPVYGGNGLRGYTVAYTHDGEFALIGRQGALCGNINYAESKFWASEHAVVVYPEKGIGTRWLGELLRSMNLGQYSVSAAQPGLSVERIADLFIPVPSSIEQTQIARFLDHETARIDALIEEQQRLIELLKEKRQAVISHAVTKGLDPTVPMKDSGVEWLGEVPVHWRVLAIKWRARIKSGDGISPDLIESQAQEDKPHPVIGGNGVMGFTSHTNVSPPLIVIGRVGALCGNVHKIHDPAWVSDNALILDFDRRSFDINYLVHVLDARNLNDISDKSAQPLITGSKVTSQYIPCPCRQEQLAIAKFLERTLSEFDQLVLEGIKGIELLKERCSALISAAVTGKVDVRGWQPPASEPSPELVQEAV